MNEIEQQEAFGERSPKPPGNRANLNGAIKAFQREGPCFEVDSLIQWPFGRIKPVTPRASKNPVLDSIGPIRDGVGDRHPAGSLLGLARTRDCEAVIGLIDDP